MKTQKSLGMWQDSSVVSIDDILAKTGGMIGERVDSNLIRVQPDDWQSPGERWTVYETIDQNYPWGFDGDSEYITALGLWDVNVSMGLGRVTHKPVIAGWNERQRYVLYQGYGPSLCRARARSMSVSTFDLGCNVSAEAFGVPLPTRRERRVLDNYRAWISKTSGCIYKAPDALESWPLANIEFINTWDPGDPFIRRTRPIPDYATSVTISPQVGTIPGPNVRFLVFFLDAFGLMYPPGPSGITQLGFTDGLPLAKIPLPWSMARIGLIHMPSGGAPPDPAIPMTLEWELFL